MVQLLSSFLAFSILLTQTPQAYGNSFAAMGHIEDFHAKVMSEQSQNLKQTFGSINSWGALEATFSKTYKKTPTLLSEAMAEAKGRKFTSPSVETFPGGFFLKQGKLVARFDLKSEMLTIGGKTISFVHKTPEEIFDFAHEALGPQKSVTHFILNLIVPDAHAEPVTIIILFIAGVVLAGDLIASFVRQFSCENRVQRFYEFAIAKNQECRQQLNSEYDHHPNIADDLLSQLNSNRGLRNEANCKEQLRSHSLFERNASLLIPGNSGSCMPEETARLICQENRSLEKCKRNIELLRRSVNQSDRQSRPERPVNRPAQNGSGNRVNGQ